MKTWITACLVIGFWLHLSAQTNRTWIFQTGLSISGSYYSSGNQFTVIKHDGTNCFLRTSDLSSNDQIYIAEKQFELRQARFDAETNQFLNDGLINFNSKIIEGFPTENWNKNGWMDASFEAMDRFAGRDSILDMGFDVNDNSGNFNNCAIKKDDSDLVNLVMNLKSGDKIRMFGSIWMDAGEVVNETHPTPYFIVTKIEIIETKSEQDLFSTP